MKNIVLANELATNEAVVTEEATINEDEMTASEEAEQPTEEGVQEEKEFNQPDETEKTIKEDVKAISPDKISSIFPDANLAEAIRDKLGESSVDDVVTQAELDGITNFLVTNKGIVDISGVENLTNLKLLSLGSNEISDISPVANLTNLTVLKLSNNQLNDISPLSNLTSLDELSLGSNEISDISPVENLTNLTWLELFYNQLSDISPLSNLTKLRLLSLHNNQLSDISPVENLTNLTNLNLNNNQLNDISPLSNLTGLNNLSLNSNEISDISPLSTFPNLFSLSLKNNQLSDISPLSNLTNLTNLSLDNQSIFASKAKWNDPLSVTNAIKDLNGNLIVPSSISNQGAYTNSTITWTGLTNASQTVNYSWSQSVTIGNATNTFNGTFNLPVEKSVQYNLFFDIDGQVTTELVEVGKLVTKPQDPNKDGYAFIGWYDAEIGGNKWDFSTDTMPAKEMTLYARFNKLGFVTPEVDPLTPSVEPPTTPGEGPNVVLPTTPGAGGNQLPSNDSELNVVVNTGNMTITSQEDTATSSPATFQESKLAKLGENRSLLLQGFGLLLVLSGMIFFWKKRKNGHS
ncbi:leucine-rich repeat domain-containing protein [Listeria farberi]|nr:leucine-rich repeat domain-containing protein [Listeria farberi]